MITLHRLLILSYAHSVVGAYARSLIGPQRAETDAVAQDSGATVTEAEVRSSRPSHVRVNVHDRETTHRKLQDVGRALVPLREHDGASLATPELTIMM